MGAVAKGVSENNGQVLGVVPQPMYKLETNYIGETVVVPDMHSRKKRMADEVNL
jgi:predicted Rossmann-fold nucleotide-binding protein